MNASRRNLIDIGDIARMLAGRTPDLVLQLLPNGRRQSSEWVCGSLAGEPGKSLAVHLHGAKAGVWKDFASDEGGDALDLVAAVLFAGNKGSALTWARRWLGLDSGDPAALAAARRAVPDADALEQAAAAEAEHGRAAGKRLWLSAQPAITGTPVDWYLRGRDIDIAKLGRQPRALRFHPALYHKASNRLWPAMVAAITGPGGFLAVHRTWLDVTGDGQASKAPVDPPKAVLGGYKGGHIALWRGATDRPLRLAAPGECVDISEGIEDGLSVAVAIPECRVLAAVSVSNMGALSLPPAISAVVLWRQNDTKTQAIAAFERAARAHLAAGRTVTIPRIEGPGIKDANDLLRSTT